MDAIESFEILVGNRVNEIERQFDEIDPDVFVGQHQWFIRCNGKSLWISVETQSTWFDDDDTMACGDQQWDRSSFDRGEDESDEEYFTRFAEECRPEFPRGEVEKRIVQRFLDLIADNE